MSRILENRFKTERYIAYSLIEKLKSSSVELKSNNPICKNGVKYIMSKEKYNDIINNTLNRRCSKYMNKELIKEFINYKLIPV